MMNDDLNEILTAVIMPLKHYIKQNDFCKNKKHKKSFIAAVPKLFFSWHPLKT